MTITNVVHDPRKHHIALATILLSIAIVLFIVASFLVFTTTSALTVALICLSLVIGLVGFNRLEKSSQSKPVTPVVFESESFGAVLSEGTGFEVWIEITITPHDLPLNAINRLKTRIQGTLNFYASKNKVLPEEPFSMFEKLFENAIAPLSKELQIETLTIRTTDVRMQGSPNSPARGIYYGSA